MLTTNGEEIGDDAEQYHLIMMNESDDNRNNEIRSDDINDDNGDEGSDGNNNGVMVDIMMSAILVEDEEDDENEDENENNDNNDDNDDDDDDRMDDRSDCKKIRRNDPTITSYSISAGLRINNYRLTRLGHALRGNTRLEKMDLYIDFKISIQGIQALATGIRRSKLKKLVIHNCDDVDDGTIVQTLYLEGLQHCKTMQSLLVHGDMGDAHALASVIPKLVEITFFYPFEISIPDFQILGNAFRESLQLKILDMEGCKLGDEHLHVLAPIIGNHPSLEELCLRSNRIGDEGISSFVEQWHSKSLLNNLDFCRNEFGPIGAHLLMIKVAQQSRMYHLNLNQNTAIGFDGLKMIGNVLPGTKLIQLCLSDNVEWTYFDNDKCEAAVQHNTKCIEAGRAVLEGVRANYYLEELHLYIPDLPRNICQEIDVYTLANKNHRHLLLQQTTLPLGLWCYILAKGSQTTSTIFLFLLELDVLMTCRSNCLSLQKGQKGDLERGSVMVPKATNASYI